MRGGKLAPFFQEPCFRVINPIRNNWKLPTIRTTDRLTYVALQIAKSGFFSGNPELVLNSPVDIVLKTYHYINFIQDYEDTSIELNKENK